MSVQIPPSVARHICLPCSCCCPLRLRSLHCRLSASQIEAVKVSEIPPNKKKKNHWIEIRMLFVKMRDFFLKCVSKVFCNWTNCLSSNIAVARNRKQEDGGDKARNSGRIGSLEAFSQVTQSSVWWRASETVWRDTATPTFPQESSQPATYALT